MKYLCVFLILLFCSFHLAAQNLRYGISTKGFKDRALCKCLVFGLDSNITNLSIQKLVPYDPISLVLFDSAIVENLKPILKEMYNDSILRIKGSSEAAQGKPVFNFCMKYYNSSQLNNLAKKELQRIKKIKDLEDYISIRFPAF